MQRPTQTQANSAKVVLAYIKPEDTRHWYQAFTQHGVRATLFLRETEAIVRLSEDPPDLLLIDSRPYHLKTLAAVTAIAAENRLRATAIHVIVARHANGIQEQYWSAGVAACHDGEEDKLWAARQMIGSATFIRRLLNKENAPAQSDFSAHVLTNVLRQLQESAFILPAPQRLRSSLGVDLKEIETLVRRTHGQTVRQWIKAEKMAYAAYLLGASRYTIGDIADLLGYSTSANFTTAFRMHHGTTPAQYRRILLLNEPPTEQPR